MRRIAILAVAALSLAACSKDSTGPGETSRLVADAGAFGTALTVAGGYEADVYQTRLANGLPDDIALSSEQLAKIKALVSAFETSTKADREALGAILRDARQATEARKSREEVNAILARGADIRARLAAAEAKLKSDIDALLTAEQLAWIASHSPRNCRADRFPALTDAQKAQIKAIEASFQDKNKADLEAVKQVMREVEAAIKAGKPRDEIARIVERAATAIARLVTARQSLREQILGVLTPEQKSSGCVPLG